MSVEGLVYLSLLAGAATIAVVAIFWLLLGALTVWPLALILTVVGGFVGGGVGAVAGVGISGAVGLFVLLAQLDGEL